MGEAATYHEAVRAHFERAWGVPLRGRGADGPRADKLGAGFEVLTGGRVRDLGLFGWATCGMATPDDPDGLELHMYAPQDGPEIHRLLCATAHYHRTGARLGLGHTVSFGRPWLPDSACEFGLLSRPYLHGPGLEWLGVPGGDSPVRCLWLLPITRAERDFKAAHGLDALEERFEGAGLDYANPLRASVVER